MNPDVLIVSSEIDSRSMLRRLEEREIAPDPNAIVYQLRHPGPTPTDVFSHPAPRAAACKNKQKKKAQRLARRKSR